MADLPSMPLYVGDFEADTSHLTLEEDGAYNRLLRLCWLTPSCSIPADPKWIARRMRVSDDDFNRVVKPVIEEFFKSSKGRIWQKRQKQEYLFATDLIAKRKQAGMKGGTAKALKRKDIDPSKALASKPKPKPKPIEDDPKGSGDLLGNLAPADPSIAERAVAMWNDLAKREDLPRVQLLTDTRRKALKARLEDAGGLDGWERALGLIEQTPFLLGANDRGWKADFDFLLQRKSFVKLMEGGYPRGPRRGGGSAAMAELRGMMHNGK